MSLGIGATEEIEAGVNYYFHPKHHNPGGWAGASIWSIGFQLEFDLAKESRDKEFMLETSDKYSWNVNRDLRNHLQVLGRKNSSDEYIARFDRDGNQIHGYTIDHKRNREKPENIILEKIQLDGKLTKKEMLRLACGVRL